MPLVSVVGSKVPSVAGGVPVPQAISTLGAPSVAYFAHHLTMLWPAGGVIAAVTGVGCVTCVPPAGETVPMLGSIFGGGVTFVAVAPPGALLSGSIVENNASSRLSTVAWLSTRGTPIGNGSAIFTWNVTDAFASG